MFYIFWQSTCRGKLSFTQAEIIPRPREPLTNKIGLHFLNLHKKNLFYKKDKMDINIDGLITADSNKEPEETIMTLSHQNSVIWGPKIELRDQAIFKGTIEWRGIYGTSPDKLIYTLKLKIYGAEVAKD